MDKKPALMGIFYRGLATSRPVSMRVTGNRDPMAEDQYARANPVSDLFQTVDLISFAALVMSLLAMVFSYDLVSGEKEGGTLRLALSFPVPRDTLLLGKWIGGCLALALPFLLTACCCLGIVVLYPGAEVSGKDLAGFGLLVCAALLYTGGFYTLGLLVSAATSRAFTSVTVLVALWVALCVGVPNLSPYLAQALLPAPAVQEVEREKWAVTGEENRARVQRIRAYRQTTTDTEAQQGVVISELYRDCFMNIARGHEQIQAAYERAWSRQAFGAYAQDLKRKADAGELGEDWLKPEEVPVLRIQPRGIEEAFGTIAVELLILALLHVAAFGMAYVCFLRYDVR